jgi:hypothetical protein
MGVTVSGEDRGEPIDEARPSSRSDKPHVCGECKYAQLVPLQAPVVCTCEDSDSRGMVHFSGQRACADMSLRAGEALVPSDRSSDLKRTPPQLASTPARMH